MLTSEEMRVPWTARRSNQSILKEISPEYSLKGLILKLKLQYFGHLIQRADSFEKTLMLGKTAGRKRGWHRMRWLDGISDSMEMSLSKSSSWWWTGKPGVLQPMVLQRVGHDWGTELNWREFSTTKPALQQMLKELPQAGNTREGKDLQKINAKQLRKQ